MKCFGRLIIFIFIISSCKSSGPSSLQDVLKHIGPQVQRFGIDPTKDTLLTGEKGTKIYLPANLFQYPDGKLPLGNVVIEIKEFYSISDFASNRLSSVSDSFLLETGGMLHITARSGGESLVTNHSKSFVLAFPRKDTAKRMEIFYGSTSDTGNVNWLPAIRWRQEGDWMGGLDSSLIDSSMFAPKIHVCGLIAISDNDEIRWKLKHSDSSIYTYVDRRLPAPDPATFNLLCDQGFKAEMHLFLSPEGRVTGVKFDPYPYLHTTPPVTRAYFTDFLKSLPSFDMTEMELYDPGEGYYISFCCWQGINQDEYDRRFREKYLNKMDRAVERMGSAALNYYVLSSSRLGWINCDRFMEDKSEKVDFIVSTTEVQSTQVMIAFDNLNSIMQGDKGDGGFVFRNIPLNSKVRIIGIGFKNGKALLSKKPATITNQTFVLSDFNPFSLKELEAELNK